MTKNNNICISRYKEKQQKNNKYQLIPNTPNSALGKLQGPVPGPSGNSRDSCPRLAKYEKCLNLQGKPTLAKFLRGSGNFRGGSGPPREIPGNVPCADPMLCAICGLPMTFRGLEELYTGISGLGGMMCAPVLWSYVEIFFVFSGGSLSFVCVFCVVLNAF